MPRLRTCGHCPARLPLSLVAAGRCGIAQEAARNWPLSAGTLATAGCTLLLQREGVAINWKKLYRLYKEERLTVKKRGGRKRALGTRAPMAIPQDANQHWSLDFVSDKLTDGRRFRILCVIDEFNRECLFADSNSV